MGKFYQSVALLFLARQGYWNEANTVKELSLIQLTYKYILSSIGLIFMFFIIRQEIFSFLRGNKILDILSYFELGMILVPAILLLGIIYENIYVLRTNTENTMRIFFNISKIEFWNITFFKNLILVSPILVIIFFYNVFVGLLSCLIIFLSNIILYAPNIKFFRLRFKRSLSIAYLLSIVDCLTVFKTIAMPVVSTFLFMFMWMFLPDFLRINTSNKMMVLNTALFSGSIFFSNKGLSFYFLVLNKDLPYLRAIGIDVKKFIQKIIWGFNINSILFPVVSLYFFLNYLKYSYLDISIFLFGVTMAYFLCQGIQMLEIIIFRKYHFKNAKELDAFSIPINTRIMLYIIRFVPVMVCLLFNQIKLFGLWGLILLNIVYISVIYCSLYRHMLSKVIKGDNHVHFIH